tara:strand:- start:1057 stop:2895 length:1839 start_codon:yes stop_codon:yes gene_type:complete
MSLENFTDYKLPKNAYLSFDATSLKSLIIDRLNENETFTDQNFEGSNFSAFIDVVSYMYHVLLFQLNTTSNESTFNTATIYDNMSKLVSNIGYKPQGDQTSLLNFNLAARNLNANVYTVPRFSSVDVNGFTYSTLDDITFQKVTNTILETVAVSNNNLYQGAITEATFSSIGEPYETITLVDTFTTQQVVKVTRTVNDQQFISDNSFRVFVQDADTSVWTEWSETVSLFLESPTATSYEKKFNEGGNYDFRFGNNNNGRQLNANDTVLIFYITSNNEVALASPNAITSSTFNLYTSPAFNEISNYIYNADLNLINTSNKDTVLISNQFQSTPIKLAETVDQIRDNAPKIFSTQNRLVSKTDYETQINRNFNNITKDVKVLDNNDYTGQYLRYFNRIGLDRPNDDGRVLLGQVGFSASTNFNNVYVYTVPSNQPVINEQLPNFLNPAQKQIISNFCIDKKDVTHNVVIADPIFKAISFGVGSSAIQTDPDTLDDIVNNSFIRLSVDQNIAASSSSIRTKVLNIFKKYFDLIQLGGVVETGNISRDILNIDGVINIDTVNGDNVTPNLSFIVWNPDYRLEDNLIQTQEYNLEDYEFAYFYEISNITSKIAIQRL